MIPRRNEGHAMDRQPMSKSEIRDKFLRDHRRLRAKAAVVTTLALSVLRGDEDLTSALRLKGEELYTHLLDHMQWEEAQLIPLLAESSVGESTCSSMLKDHVDQRQRLGDSLSELRHPGSSLASLAKDCLDHVRWLEVDMADEEREVLRSIVLLE
jgi:iron-sulfur cluster repair protein YtfE (RIC family)